MNTTSKPNRLETIVSDIVSSVREVLIRHNVTFEEYRAGCNHLVKTGEAGELVMLADVFLNTTICEIEDTMIGGSTSTIEGPFYLEDAPFVDGSLKMHPDDSREPMIVRGSVTDTSGKPVPDAIVDVWHCDPNGLYGGFGIPNDMYRGKVRTNTAGQFELRSTIPVPYPLPQDGPTAKLLHRMGRHSWRPAHVHFKVKKAGYHTLVTQNYFEGGDYVLGSASDTGDCCDGVRPDLIKSDQREGVARVVENVFRIALEKGPVAAH